MAAKLLNSPDITSKIVFFFHFFSLFLVLRQFLSVITLPTHSFDDIFRLFLHESFWESDDRNLLFLDAESFSAFGACEMHVVEVMIMVFALA